MNVSSVPIFQIKDFILSNMQFEEEEYYEVKQVIMDWITES